MSYDKNKPDKTTSPLRGKEQGDMPTRMVAKGAPSYGTIPLHILHRGFFCLSGDPHKEVYYGLRKDTEGPMTCHAVLEDGSLSKSESGLDGKADIILLSQKDLGIADIVWEK